MKFEMKKSPKKIEVETAREGLRGALNESLNGRVSENDEEQSKEEEACSVKDENPKQKPREQLPRNRRLQLTPIKIHITAPKKHKNKQKNLVDNATKPGETFVMKLFDRSLDLSSYTEKTPLYPICRAWMANQPRNPEVHKYKKARTPSPVKEEDDSKEILQRLLRGDITDVYSLPKSKPATVPKIPKPLKRCADNVDDEDLKDASKEKLLAANMKNWKAARRNWMEHTKEYNKRFEDSHHILELLLKRQ